MKKTLTIVGAVILVAAITFPVMAYGPGQGKGMGMGMGISNWGSSSCESIPNLTPEQSAKLAELKAQRLKEVLPLQKELIAKRAELRALWAQTNPDEAKIKAKQHEVTELENTLQEKMTNYRLECRNVLTPEQQAQLKPEQPRKGYGYKAQRPGARGYGRMRNW